MALTSPRADLVGASEPSIPLPGAKITTRVNFLQAARQAVLARLAGKRPVHAHLNLEHITGSGVHGSYQVYIEVPPAAGAAPAPAPAPAPGTAPAAPVATAPGASAATAPGAPAGHAPLFAGILSTFGVRKASLKDGPHGGSGITTVLDITPLIHKLHDEHGWDGHHLDVTLVPEIPPGRKEPMPPSDLKIGRVSVFYS
jgi:tyrosinase